MKNRRWLVSRMNDRSGATAVVVAIVMSALIGFTALAVDIGYVMTTRNELQDVADAVTLAAARQLGAIYESMSYQEVLDFVCDPSTILPIAKEVGSKNQAGGKNIAINDADVIIGQWDPDTKTLTPTLGQPDAVGVTARRDGNTNGPITTFFARILGINTVDVSADATAALTGQSTVEEGGLDVPVGIDNAWYDYPWEDGFCDQDIKFYPTGTIEGCAGWHTFNEWPSNANRLAGILDGMKEGSYQSPSLDIGDELVFTGGTVASAFDEMKALYDERKDPVTGVWEARVVVYENQDCGNPQGWLTIVGFATVKIEQVQEAPEKTIRGTVICNNVEPGRGSGGNFGTKGSIPGLVE
jgi:hypothetical protein